MPETDVNIYPYLYYKDAHAVIDWMVKALGFSKVIVVPRDDGAVMHSELRFGAGIVMVSTAGDYPGTRSPVDAGGSTGGIAIYIDDGELDAHYARAKASGVAVDVPLKAQDYGGRSYSLRDPEGGSWTVGSYRAGVAASP